MLWGGVVFSYFINLFIVSGEIVRLGFSCIIFRKCSAGFSSGITASLEFFFSPSRFFLNFQFIY